MILPFTRTALVVPDSAIGPPHVTDINSLGPWIIATSGTTVTVTTPGSTLGGPTKPTDANTDWIVFTDGPTIGQCGIYLDCRSLGVSGTVRIRARARHTGLPSSPSFPPDWVLGTVRITDSVNFPLDPSDYEVIDELVTYTSSDLAFEVDVVEATIDSTTRQGIGFISSATQHRGGVWVDWVSLHTGSQELYYQARTAWLAPPAGEINSLAAVGLGLGDLPASVWSLGAIPEADVRLFSCERTAADQFQRVSVGQGNLVLADDARDYVPGTSSVDLFANVAVVAWTEMGSAYGVFNGYASRIEHAPGRGRTGRTSVFVEDVARFLDSEVNVPLQLGRNVGSVAAVVGSALNFPDSALYNVPDTFADFVGPGAIDRVSGAEAIDRIIKSGAHFGYVHGDGRLTIRDRNFDLIGDASASFQSVLEMPARLSLSDVYNDVRISGESRSKLSPTSVFAFLTEDVPSVAASSEATFFVEYLDPVTYESPFPVQSIQGVTATTDWQLNAQPDGSGTDLTGTASLTMTAFAQTAKIEVFNGSNTDGYLYRLNITGDPLQADPPFSAIEEDSTSQTKYRRRTYDLQNGLIANVNQAKGLAEYLVDRRANPLMELSVEMRDWFPESAEIDLLSIVHAVNSDLNVASDQIVTGVAHEISFSDRGTMHTVEYQLRMRETKTYLILDDAVAGELDDVYTVGY